MFDGGYVNGSFLREYVDDGISTIVVYDSFSGFTSNPKLLHFASRRFSFRSSKSVIFYDRF
jgi:hypothetical protein